MQMEWHPRNYFQMSSVAPIVIVFLGANGSLQEKYTKVIAAYIAKRGMRACVILR